MGSEVTQFVHVLAVTVTAHVSLLMKALSQAFSFGPLNNLERYAGRFHIFHSKGGS